MTWQRNLNNVDSHKSLIRANVFFAVCAECFPPWCWFKVVSGGPDKFGDLYSAKVPRYIRRFRRKSWQNVFVETSAAKVCFHLRAMSGFGAMYDFRGMKLSGSIFVQDFRNFFICVHGRRCILHAMRKRFQAWLEMRSFLWFFVAGVVFGELGLCFEQIWTARGHRFVNIRYFSACHDFAWQVQDSARFRMPQAHFSWEAQ